MRLVCCGLLAVALLASPSAKAAKEYSMSDLKALEKQESWQEIYEHLEDIPPGKRDDEWKAVGENAVVHLLGDMKIEPNYGYEHVIATMEAVQKRYPSIGKSKGYLNKRMEVGEQAFKKTFSNYRHSGYDDPWRHAIVKFVMDDPTTVELPLRMAKMQSKLLVESTVVPLYVEAVKRQKDVACKDPALHEMVVEVAAEEEVWKEEIASLVDDKCAAQVRPVLVKAVDTVKTPDEKANICKVLKVKGPAPASCGK